MKGKMKRCDACKIGIAEHEIEDCNPPLHHKPGEIWGKVALCENCFKSKVKTAEKIFR